MNWRTIWAIAVKDWQEIRQNRMAWTPVLILPLIFVVVLPLLIILGPTVLNIPVETMMQEADMELFLKNMPPVIADQIAGLNDHQTLIVLMLGFMLAPMLLIMPLMVSSSFGAESFVGEKERRTIEALLYTPATDQELFLGKMLTSVAPAILISWLSFALYTLTLNIAGGPVMGRVWFPTPAWWPLMLWVTPALAVLGMIAAVLISARVNSFMEAYQATGMLVIPVILLIVAQVGGVVYLGVETALIIGFVIWAIDAALMAVGLRLFSRLALMRRV